MGSTSCSMGSVLELKKRNDSIYEFYEPPECPTAVIIFFHDVHWSEHKEPHLETWMSSSSPSICWPREWLSKKFSHARILSARYDAAIWKTNTAGRMDLYRIAENLWQDILGTYEGNCFIFLVGHGLGGLVIKAVIRSIHEKLGCISASDVRTKDRLSSFLKNLAGVFFYNTPFLGTRLADYTGCFSNGSPLLKIIKTLNEDSSRLNEWFRGWRSGGRCKSIVIYASLPTKVALGLGHWHSQVVEEPSTRLDTDYFYTHLSNHFGVCKPPDQIDNRFSMLTKFLHDGMTRENGPPQIKDYSATTPCKELTSILGEVAKFKHVKGLGLILRRDYLEKIRKIPEMERLLLVGLEEAGLTQSRVCGATELWVRL